MAKTRKYNEQVATSCGGPIKRHTVPVANAVCYQVTHVHNVVNIAKLDHFQNVSTYSVPYTRQEKLHFITILRGPTY